MDEIKGSPQVPGFSPKNIQKSAGSRRNELRLARSDKGPNRQKGEQISEQIRLGSSGVLNQLRSSENERANNLIRAANDQIDSARKARYNTTKQLRVAKRLRSALSEGNRKQAQQFKEEIGRLQREARQVEQQVATRNNLSESDRIGSLRSGGGSKDTFHVSSVDFEAKTSEPSSLKSPEDTEQFIAQLRKSRSDLTDQISELRKTRSSINEVTSDARGNLTQFDDSIINSVEGAESEAAAFASQLRQAAGADVSIIQRGSLQIAHNLNDDKVARLLRS